MSCVFYVARVSVFVSQALLRVGREDVDRPLVLPARDLRELHIIALQDL